MNSQAYILGGAQTDFERNWTKEGKNVIALLKEAISDGFANTGISYDDVIAWNRENRVACFVGNFIAEQYVNQGHLGALLTEVDPAFYGVPSARYEAACASSSVALDAAIAHIHNGDYDVAIVVGWELMKTVDSKVGGDILGKAAYYEQEGQGIDFPFPKLFGRLADEMLLKYDVEETRFMDALARISTLNYENAKRNPLAQTRKWFMSFEQARTRGTETNPCVGGRLAVSDCSQVTDGAVGFVRLKDDLSDIDGEPKNLFRASYVNHTWGRPIPPDGSGYVTDGPFVYKGKTGKLYMIWTTNNSCGIAISDSGKIAGPWRQQDEALITGAGHGMIFKTFEGVPMLALHAPYWGDTHPKIFELEDTGETLRIVREVK